MDSSELCGLIKRYWLFFNVSILLTWWIPNQQSFCKDKKQELQESIKLLITFRKYELGYWFQCIVCKAKLFYEAMFFVIIFTNLRQGQLQRSTSLPKIIMQAQSGNGVLNRLVPCLKCIKLACWVLQVVVWTCILP